MFVQWEAGEWTQFTIRWRSGKEPYKIFCHKTVDEKRVMRCFSLSKLTYHQLLASCTSSYAVTIQIAAA